MATLTAEENRNILIESAPAWVPKEPGERLAGNVVGVLHREITNQYGHQVYPAVVLDVSTDPEAFEFVSVHVLGTVLSNKLRSMKPKIGDRLVFAYIGQKESGGGNRYADIVVTDGTAPKQFDWDAPTEPPVMPQAAEPAKGAKRKQDDNPPF